MQHREDVRVAPQALQDHALADQLGETSLIVEKACPLVGLCDPLERDKSGARREEPGKVDLETDPSKKVETLVQLDRWA